MSTKAPRVRGREGPPTRQVTASGPPEQSLGGRIPIPPADGPIGQTSGGVGPARHVWPNTTRGRAVLAGATACCLLLVAYHLVMVFLWNAPRNVATDALRGPLRAWISPVFAQGWELFAPNPWSANTHLVAQVRVKRPDGTVPVSEWIDLTAQDMAGIEANPVPSRANQDTILKATAWYFRTHDDMSGERTDGGYSILAEEYLYRIAAHRVGATHDGGRTVALRIQLVTTSIPPPPWTGPSDPVKPSTVTLDWWETTSDDF